jgi:uncharacterized membrane protein YphA (DoxX/SURF4 family)
MNLVLWIVAALLALAFLAAGVMKLTQPKEKLATSGMRVDRGLQRRHDQDHRCAGVARRYGLILPALLNIAPVLVPVAALGLVVIMLGAAYTHARRKEYPMILSNLLLLVLAAFVAWGRLSGVPFTA